MQKVAIRSVTCGKLHTTLHFYIQLACRISLRIGLQLMAVAGQYTPIVGRGRTGLDVVDKLTPKRSPTAERTASSSSLVPHAATGRACSQSPLGGTETARMLALRGLSVRLDKITDLSAGITGASHTHCFVVNV